MVCHSGAINLRSGFGRGSVVVNVVAIFVLVRGCEVQNISETRLAVAEMRSSNPEGYAMLDTRVRARSGCVPRGLRLHERFGH